MGRRGQLAGVYCGTHNRDTVFCDATNATDMGIIDTHSEYSLYDILDGSLGMSEQGRGFKEPEGTVDFYGFHVFPTSDNGAYTVQYDGHVGAVDKLYADDYDDVLELVDDLMTHVFEVQHFDYQDDKEALVEYAGKIMTSDEEKADAHPDLYTYIPDDITEVEGASEGT